MKCCGFPRLRRRRRSDENGFVKEERRAEKSRGSFVDVIDVVRDDFTSSAQLKRSEISENEGF